VLYLRDADGSGTRLLATSGRPSRPAFSAAGKRIAYAAKGAIWVMQADGSFRRQVTANYFAADGDPAWSPRGDAVVFTRGGAGGRDIFSIGLDGNDLRRLTSKDADETAPVWSSRDRIAFVRHTADGDGDLWAVAPTGGAARRLTSGRADDREPAWSPDGRRIAFTRNSPGHRDVYVADDRGRHVRKLRSLPQPASSPVWSPNGRWIAFAMGKAGRRALYVMRTNGKGLRRIAKGSTDARALDWQARPGDPVVAAAGDVACDSSQPGYNDGYGTATSCRERYTSNQMLKLDLDAVLMLGDAHQYIEAPLSKFLESYDPTWGRLKPITRPAVGNHEYGTPGAAGYFDYFNGVGRADGPAGLRGQGWYSYDVGAWHIIALNSNCNQVSCVVGSPQEQWLRADLVAHPTRCTLAYFHHPLVSSGASEGSIQGVQPLWQALYDAGADLVLNGHDHAYERFAPLTPTGAVDPVRGIREIVSGTGGKSHQGASALRPGSEVRDSTSFGVTRLTLRPTGYEWQFLPDTPGGFTDAGTANCH
jgi:dipeptidyl aminopeptidase/acylaminoacyl peptidase